MAVINLYKLDSDKQTDFLRVISEQMIRSDSVEINDETNPDIGYGLTLYYHIPEDEHALRWNWVFESFNCDDVHTVSSPKAIILIERKNDHDDDQKWYAVTFGSSFFLVDKYCDRDFGFDFARKLDYQEIKTTTLTSPNSHRNRTINTYIDYNELEFDSGESFAKLKACAKLPEGFTLFKPSLEIGSSIKFLTVDDSLSSIITIIEFIEDTLMNQPDKYKIPVYKKVKDNQLIERLNNILMQTVFSPDNDATLHFSELEIIGSTEIFNSNDNTYVLKYKQIEKQLVHLSIDDLRAFWNENGLADPTVVADTRISVFYDGEKKYTRDVLHMIECTIDEEQCILTKGIWYQYNQDYLAYLRDSISDIPAIYNPLYDLSGHIIQKFIDQKYKEEKNFPEYRGKTAASVRESLKKKYYAERVFNLLREKDNGFINRDRHNISFNGESVELMDLFKDETAYAVKIGNSSSKLCYVVDQSETALKLIKRNQIDDIPEIKRIAIWIVLERSTHIEDANGIPDINRLKMLLLHNRLDVWKKEVRLAGMTPEIYINYRTR